MPDIDLLRNILLMVRAHLEKKYGAENLAGKCIEASEIIVAILKAFGYENAHTVEGWCHYDDPAGCSNRDYDEHTWVELDGLYIDVTADQFNPYMDKPFDKIIINTGLSHGMCYEEPETDEEDINYGTEIEY